MKRYPTIIAYLLLFAGCLSAQVKSKTEFSTAGFYKVDGGGREVYSFNQGWRFAKGNFKNAALTNFNDSQWQATNLPHGLELLPTEASGGINYQGPAWYRKKFDIPQSLKGKKIYLYFEAVMGKSQIWINGQLVKEHFGGYIPFSIEVSQHISFDKENLVAVFTDNSNNPAYPPGKPQEQLDFCYFGGIYRDVWLYSTSAIHITDPNYTNKVAAGGLFTRIESASEKLATLKVRVDVQNETKSKAPVVVVAKLLDKDGKLAAQSRQSLALLPDSSSTAELSMSIKAPNLWTPETPYLYNLVCEIHSNKEVVDAIRQRTGIRTIELKGKDGFILNGKRYQDKLIGGNRHQDYAYVGNALPNSGQWRDAVKLRSAGMRIIRSAHYPLDPAFMDAADELGLFVIVSTPGWQFWNNDPLFEQRVLSDISQMVRRDRNRPSVFMWEPILNETWYPEYFAKKVHDLVHAEYPYKGAYTACDLEARGSEHFDVVYSHPFLTSSKGMVAVSEENKGDATGKNPYDKITRPMFNREWGDNVDNWNSHNSPSRVAKTWGETAMLIQAKHYSMPSYPYTCFQTLYQSPRQMMGGALWHPFDHQRGYHPDPFYGGIMDVFRQPKYSYYMFRSQSDPKLNVENVDCGPMVFVANEMSPFSPEEVTVFTNCEQVRLIINSKDTLVQSAQRIDSGMLHPPVVFKNVFNFMELKALSRANKDNLISLEAQGIIDGKVVATHVRRPSFRPEKIRLELDNLNRLLVADGSDFVPIIASITDKDGNVKRLNEYQIRFEVEGEGSIVGDEQIGANPRKVEWGTAPVLVRSTTKPGKIRVKASVLFPGSNMPSTATLEFESIRSDIPVIAGKNISEAAFNQKRSHQSSAEMEVLKEKLQKVQMELNQIKNKEVEKQQSEFEK